MLGEAALSYVIHQYLPHYHPERNHLNDPAAIQGEMGREMTLEDHGGAAEPDPSHRRRALAADWRAP